MSEEEPRQIAATQLRVAARDDGWHVELDDGLLHTPAGHPVVLRNRRLADHIVRELAQYPVLSIEDAAIVEPRPVCAYFLLASQQDFAGHGEAAKPEELHYLLEHDPTLDPVDGPEQAVQQAAWEPLASYLEGLGQQLLARSGYTTEQWGSLRDRLGREWEAMSIPRRTIVANLWNLHEHNFLAPMALMRGAASAIAYANAVLATTGYHHAFATEVEEGESPEDTHTLHFREFLLDAQACLEYLERGAESEG